MTHSKGKSAIGVTLSLVPVDSLRLDPVDGLEDAVTRLRLYRYSQDEWIVQCGTRSSGSAHVDAGRVVLRVTDRRLARDLLKAHPSSAWFLVRRANQGQETHFSRQVTIQYSGGA